MVNAHRLLQDISSPRLIVVKGCLFVALGVMASGLLVAALFEAVHAHAWQQVVLHGVAVWSFCRAYYFAFYVIERYIDPMYRFAGLSSATVWMLRGRGRDVSAGRRPVRE